MVNKGNMKLQIGYRTSSMSAFVSAILSLLLLLLTPAVDAFCTVLKKPQQSHCLAAATTTTTHLQVSNNPTQEAPQVLSDSNDDDDDWLFQHDDDDDDGELFPSDDEVDDENMPTALNDDAQDVGNDDDIVRFVNMMKDTPAGLLEEDIALLLRETMEELIGVAADDDGEDDNNVVETLGLATDLLQRLVQEYQAVQRMDSQRAAVIAPLAADFDRLYAAWLSALKTPQRGIATHVLPAATEASQVLLALQQGPALENIAQPSAYTYELVLSILSQSRYCAKQTWQIFSNIEHKTMAMYDAMIASTAKSRHAHASSRAEGLLKEAAELGQPVSVDTCNRVVTSWAKSGQRFGPERAEELIRWMDTQDNIASPNAQSFTSLMDAHAQQTSWEAAVRCQRILQNLVDLYISENDPALEPTVATWTIALQAWTRLAKKNWNKAAARAARVFEQWQELHQEGKVSQGPDGLAYQMILAAFVRSDAAQAEAWLDQQYEKYQESGDESLKPTARSIRNVVESWTRQQEDPNAMEEAEFVWERYQEIIDESANSEMLTDLYKTLLFGYCQRQDTERALELLQEMVERELHPDCFSYDRVLEANTQQISGNADKACIDRAYAVFALMEEERKAGHIKPNERVYTSFIRSMTKAQIPNLAYKARILLQRMRELSKSDANPGLAPTVFTYNAVLMAAATEGVPAAFSIAVQTFNELRKDKTASLDHVSIGNMMRCANLLEEDDPKRLALIRSTFGLGCKLGLINAFVIRDLRLVAPKGLVNELLGAEYAEDEDDANIVEGLPEEWSFKGMAKQQKRF